MRAILTVLVAVLLFAGCAMTPWVRGSIVEGLPRHTQKFPKDMVFFVQKTEKRIQKSFGEALSRAGFGVVDKEEEADTLVKVDVQVWEYNDAGFSGFRGRDDMTLSVKLIDRRKKRILMSSVVEYRSDPRIFDKFAEQL